jgi:hypothetical protein
MESAKRSIFELCCVMFGGECGEGQQYRAGEKGRCFMGFFMHLFMFNSAFFFFTFTIISLQILITKNLLYVGSIL